MSKKIQTPQTDDRLKALVAQIQAQKPEIEKTKKSLEAKRKAENEAYRSHNPQTTNQAVTAEIADHVFLDDERQPGNVDWSPIPEGVVWRIIKSYDDFVKYIEKNGLPKFISFDSDLGPKSKSGLDCAKWLVKYCMKHNKDLPDWYSHSKSIVGKQSIENELFAFDHTKLQAAKK